MTTTPRYEAYGDGEKFQMLTHPDGVPVNAEGVVFVDAEDYTRLESELAAERKRRVLTDEEREDMLAAFRYGTRFLEGRLARALARVAGKGVERAE